jgi:hypothetical protein
MRIRKSDNAATVGQHCFEEAGLGKAPFRLTGFTTMQYQAAPGAPVQPGTSCDYCSTAIMYVCLVTSSDGKTFKVGCDCVGRTGDAGLITAYKSTPEYRKHQQELRQAKDEANKAELARLLSDASVRAQLAACIFTSQYAWGEARQDNRLAAIERSLPWCGAKGRADWLRTIRRVVAS